MIENSEKGNNSLSESFLIEMRNKFENNIRVFLLMEYMYGGSIK